MIFQSSIPRSRPGIAKSCWPTKGWWCATARRPMGPSWTAGESRKPSCRPGQTLRLGEVELLVETTRGHHRHSPLRYAAPGAARGVVRWLADLSPPSQGARHASVHPLPGSSVRRLRAPAAAARREADEVLPALQPPVRAARRREKEEEIAVRAFAQDGQAAFLPPTDGRKAALDSTRLSGGRV